MSRRRVSTILLHLLSVFALVATGCGDDGSTPGVTQSEDSTPEPDAGDEEPVDDETPADETPVDEAPDGIVLTDSYRGVTTESITIGVAAIDLGQVNDTFGLDFTVNPVEEMYIAWTDVINANGGINGRDLLFEYTPFFPVGADDADRICVELMQDKEVFVVTGQFLQDAMLCITELHGHPYVGHFGETPERQEKSDGLFFATEIAQVDQRGGGTQAMIDAGDFDGKSVAVVWESAEDEVYWETVEPILAAADIDVVTSISVDAFTTDTINNESSWNIAMEQIETAGADIILNLSGITGVLDAAQRTGATQTIAHTNGQAADGTTVLEESIAEDAVLQNSFAFTTWKPNLEESLADAEVQRCIAEFEAAFPDIEIDLTDSDYVNGFTNHCRALALTVRILDAAGGDITPETFRAVGEGLGAIDLPGMADAYLGPDSHSAGGVLSRYEYDAATEQYVKVGDPLNTKG